MAYDMTTNITFCLSYNLFKLDFIAFKVDMLFDRKCIVDMHGVMTLLVVT